MNVMDQFIERKICEEIDVLTMQLLSIFDENREKIDSYGEQNKRIIQNALFNLAVSLYRPSTRSPIADSNYLRYAEQAREDFNKMIQILMEFKSEKLYR